MNTDTQWQNARFSGCHIPVQKPLYLRDSTSSWETRRNNTFVYPTLTPWSRVLPEKPTGPQLVKKFPAFYETQRFITVFTTARHLSLYWARSIYSMPTSHLSKIRFNIISLISYTQDNILPSAYVHLSSSVVTVVTFTDSSYCYFWKPW